MGEDKSGTHSIVNPLLPASHRSHGSYTDISNQGVLGYSHEGEEFKF